MFSGERVRRYVSGGEGGRGYVFKMEGVKWFNIISRGEEMRYIS